MGIELAVASLIVTVAGTAASQVQAHKTRGEQRAQNRRVNASNAAKAATAKRKALREERVRRAQLIAAAEATGASGSSTAIAGEGLSGTLASEKIGSISSALDNTNALSRGAQSIADSQGRQQLFSNVASIGSSVFSAAGGAGEIDKAINK
jgi:hypothetical protein